MDLFVWDGVPELFREKIEVEHVVLVDHKAKLSGKSTAGGSVSWTENLLGELIENFDSIRVPVKQADRRPGPYPYYGASGIVDRIDDYLFDGEYLLIAEDGENLRTRNTPIAFLANGKFWVNNHAHIVRGNHKANTRYLMYALSELDIGGYLTGSTMPKLTQGNMNRIRLFIPRLPEQRSIASILGSLDDKIELNRRMNETLEAMARALFKSWFIDFDPVRAKMEGRDTGLPPHIADLFPARLVDSELGQIPEGWEVCRLEDYIELIYGKSLPAKQRKPGEVAVYGSGGIVGRHDTVLVEWPTVIVGRKGTVGSIYWEDGPSFPIDTVFYVVSLKGTMLFNYHLLASQPLRDMNTDAAVPGLNRSNVYRLEFPQPASEIITAFDDVAGSLWGRRAVNMQDTKVLIKNRELLLPKLISGEVRIGDIEKVVETIA